MAFSLITSTKEMHIKPDRHGCMLRYRRASLRTYILPSKLAEAKKCSPPVVGTRRACTFSIAKSHAPTILSYIEERKHIILSNSSFLSLLRGYAFDSLVSAVVSLIIPHKKGKRYQLNET
jgi:hypothetical protein